MAWSLASIDTVPIDEALPSDTFNRTELAEACKREGQLIIETKGAIVYGIGSVVASICESIILDRRDIRPVTHFQPNFDCCVSLPAILGRKGVVETMSLALSDEENAQLQYSGKEVREQVKALMDEN